MALKGLLKQLIPASVFKKLKLQYYSGETHLCNVCGFSMKQFGQTGWNVPVVIEKKMVGAGLRRAACPNCQSSDRERMILYFLKEVRAMDKKDKEQTILHIAPADSLGKYLRALPNTEYICGDLHPELSKYPKDTIWVDVTKLQFEDESVDGIMCNHVLEHVTEDRRAIEEFHRVLKPGGWAILQVPYSTTLEETFEPAWVNSEQERLNKFGHRDHVRLYGMDYADRIKQAGFTIDPIYLADSIGEDKVRQLGINPKEAIFFAEKK